MAKRKPQTKTPKPGARFATFHKPPPTDAATKQCSVTLHTMPSEAPPAQNAILLILLAKAWEVSQKFPDPTYPIHVAVRFGEGPDHKQICGCVSPAVGDRDVSVDLTRSTCN